MWTDSFFYTIEENRWKTFLIAPGWVFAGALLYLGCVCGGFWWLTGVKHASLLMGLYPLTLVVGFLGSAAAGFIWKACSSLINNEPILDEEFSWRQTSFEGLQLIIFYGVMGLLLYAATISLTTHGIWIPVACGIFYPLLLAPMFVSARYKDRSLLGLLGGFLDIPQFLSAQYLFKWIANSVFAFCIFTVIGPAFALVMSLSIVGLFFLPGLFLSMAMSCLHYMYQSFYADSKKSAFYNKPITLKSSNPFSQNYSSLSIRTSGDIYEIRH